MRAGKAGQIWIAVLGCTGVVVLLTSPALALAADAEDAKLPAILEAKPLKPAPGDDELRKALIARYNAAIGEVKARYQEFLAGKTTMEAMADCSRRLVHSRQELGEKPADLVAFLEQYVELAKIIEKINEHRHEAGRIGIAEVELAHYYRFDAEVRLLKAKRLAAKKD